MILNLLHGKENPKQVLIVHRATLNQVELYFLWTTHLLTSGLVIQPAQLVLFVQFLC